MRLGPSTTHDHATAIEEWGSLLAVLLAQPDAETVLPQMQRVAWSIVDHARSIKTSEERRHQRCA